MRGKQRQFASAATAVPKTAFDTALAFHRRGKLRQAEQLYRTYLKADPRHVGALVGLGVALAGRRGFADAVVLFRRALAVSPNSFDAHANLGAVLVALKREEDAILHLESALALNPQHAESHNALGAAHANANRDEMAVAHFERAIAHKPNYADALSNLAAALQRLGRYGAAHIAINRAIASDSGNAEFHSVLGGLHSEMGTIDAAKAAFEQALKLAPQRTDVHHRLALVTQYHEGHPHLTQMKILARNMRSMPPIAQIELCFALAKALAELGDYPGSFEYLRRGSALKRRQIVYDERTVLGRMERIRAVFDAGLMLTRRDVGDPSNLPIFIVGMPRSGTSLIEQILASHHAVFGAGELSDFEDVTTSLGLFPEWVPAASGETLRTLGARYVSAIAARAPTAERIVDKMPANFLYIGLIRLASPGARIIHARRDPIDTCMSCFGQLFVAEAQPYSYDLGELGRYYRAYDSLMAHWREVLPEGTMLEVQYEDLITDLPGNARRMMEHCGLEWDDACLEFHKTDRPVRTASFKQVREPISDHSLRRWHAHRHLLQPLLDAIAEPGEARDLAAPRAPFTRPAARLPPSHVG